MKNAFTMIELVFVIVVLGILALVAIPKLSATRDDAEIVIKQKSVTNLIAELSSYYTAHGAFEKNVSKMTHENLVDSSGATYIGNFLTTPAYIANSARTRICLKVSVDDSNGTITIAKHSDGSDYCDALISQLDNTIKKYEIGGSHIYTK